MQEMVRRGVVGALALLAVGAAMSTTASAAQPAWPAPETPVARIGPQTISFGTLERLGRLSPTVGGADIAKAAGADPRACLRRGAPGAAHPACSRVRRMTWGVGLAELIQLHRAKLEARRRGLDARPTPAMRDELQEMDRQHGVDRRLWRSGLAAALVLDRAVVATVEPPDDAALVRFWESRREPGWFTPRQVRVEVLQLRSRADADAALAAVAGGESFAAAGARLAVAGSAAFRGERQLFSGERIDDGADPRSSLTAAVLAAAPGALIGPLRFGRSFYVARVVEVVTERARIPLAQVQDQVREEVTAIRAGRAIRADLARVTAHWRPRTTCLRAVAVTSLCGRVADRL